MAQLDLTIDESVAVVTMNDGENRFNPTFISAFVNMLDSVEAEERTRLLGLMPEVGDDPMAYGNYARRALTR